MTFFTLIVNAQKHDLKVVINPADDNSLISEYDIGNKRQDPLLADTAFIYNMYVYKRIYTPFVYKSTVMIVRLFDQTSKKLMKLGDIDKNIKVKITIDGKEQIITPSQDELDMTDFNLIFNNYFKDVSLKHNSEVAIQVLVTNPNYEFNNSIYKGRYFISNYTKYQAFGADIGGFWFPTLQFSSNLKSTTDGVPFASLPIGLAWGIKYSTQKGKYFGASLMANWLIYTQPENTSPATSNSFNLQGATTGILFDINDVITLGYAYGFNFRAGSADPGHMFVLGFGSKAINFLKKDKE
jgi:hypothetical protein